MLVYAAFFASWPQAGHFEKEVGNQTILKLDTPMLECLLKVFTFEHWIVSKNLIKCHSACNHVQERRNRNA